ncbi:MAG: transposase [Desulfovibrio sp.]|nr:transposase [Desulfovibrio sp.]
MAAFLLVNYLAKIAMSSQIKSLKGVSSRQIRKRRFQVCNVSCRRTLWLPSYFADSCGGAPFSELQKALRKPAYPKLKRHGCVLYSCAFQTGFNSV